MKGNDKTFNVCDLISKKNRGAAFQYYEQHLRGSLDAFVSPRSEGDNFFSRGDRGDKNSKACLGVSPISELCFADYNCFQNTFEINI